MQATELEALDLEVPEMDDDLKACHHAAGCTGFSVSNTADMQIVYAEGCISAHAPSMTTCYQQHINVYEFASDS